MLRYAGREPFSSHGLGGDELIDLADSFTEWNEEEREFIVLGVAE